ncbi:hypothetical protein [Catellatospora vulcania]|uniref:hypothetical protein n=1 Tax=Catellatospora vulcania TaxID=1460450 RepID=UPI0012D3CCE7|nr:hypothetical protein [Catellatospora vulcania]
MADASADWADLLRADRECTRARVRMAPGNSAADVAAGRADLVQAEQDYARCLGRLLAGDPTEVLRHGLSTKTRHTQDDRRVAVHVVFEAEGLHLDVIRRLLPELFELSLAVHWISVRMWKVIGQLDPHDLVEDLTPLVAAFLADPERDASEYWGAIGLAHQVRLVPLADLLMDAARRSPDPEIRGAAEGWHYPENDAAES